MKEIVEEAVRLCFDTDYHGIMETNKDGVGVLSTYCI